MGRKPKTAAAALFRAKTVKAQFGLLPAAAMRDDLALVR